MLVAEGSSGKKAGGRWHDDDPDSFIFLEAAAGTSPPREKDASSTDSGGSQGCHTSEISDAAGTATSDPDCGSTLGLATNNCWYCWANGINGIDPNCPCCAEGYTCSFVAADDDTGDDAAEEPDWDCNLEPQEVVDLLRDKCGCSKVKGDWQQRIRYIRQLCRFFEAQCSDDEGASSKCLRSMRELTHVFAKIAAYPAPPASRGRTSGSMRKKYSSIQLAVGDFIGNDVIRALIALNEPNTCSNIEQLSLATCRAKAQLVRAGRGRETDAQANLV